MRLACLILKRELESVLAMHGGVIHRSEAGRFTELVTIGAWRWGGTKSPPEMAVSAPDGTPCTVLSLENLGIVPGQHVANDLESPILPAASLLSHDHPTYLSAHTIRERESEQGAKQ